MNIIKNFKIKLLFAWYDFWIGIYFDRKNKKLYILPIPCFGLVIDFNKILDKNPKIT